MERAMPNRRKFTDSQKKKWILEQQEGQYAGAANAPKPRRSRAEEVSAIADFVKNRGVTRVPTPAEVERQRRQEVPEVSLPDDEDIPA